MAHSLGDALSQFTSILAVPVLIAAVVVLCLCALELGRWVAELLRHLRSHTAVRALAESALAHPDRGETLAGQAPTVHVERAVKAIAIAAAQKDSDGIGYALDDYELGVERQLDRTRILVRAAPAIGLMGTLIPLAPGLRALGRGNVALLSDDLRIAFAATVIGLMSGTIAFALTLVRTRRWNADLAELERGAASAASLGAAPTGGNSSAVGNAGAALATPHVDVVTPALVNPDEEGAPQ